MIAEITQDADGQQSSKRWVSLAAFAVYLLGGIAQTLGAPVPAEFMTGLLTVIGGGLALTSAEKFAKRGE